MGEWVEAHVTYERGMGGTMAAHRAMVEWGVSGGPRVRNGFVTIRRMDGPRSTLTIPVGRIVTIVRNP